MKLTFKERLESIRQTHDYRLEKAKLEFVRGISRLMAQHEISNAELARRLDSSPAYATKVMRGDSNFTLDSMVNISHALGSTLHVRVADSSADVRWLEAFDSARSADNDAAQKPKTLSRGGPAITPFPLLKESADEAGCIYA